MYIPKKKSPPDLTVAKNLKKRHYPAVEKISAELKDVLNEQHLSIDTGIAVFIDYAASFSVICTEVCQSKSRTEKDALKSVERKYLELLKVWSLTEKQLTQIIYAREAESRIQDFYFDQVRGRKDSYHR